MAKLQIRNLDDAVYGRMMQEASRQLRSLEGEARYTLSCAYPETPLSLREAWQKDTAKRMQWIFDRLHEYHWFRSGKSSDIVSLAKLIGETSPAELLDCLDGVSGPTFDMAVRMEQKLSCRADWIMNGNGAPFRTEKLTSRYDEYFDSLLDDEGHLLPDTELYFVRYCTRDHLDGTLLILSRTRSTWNCHYEYSHFYLSGGMGSSGRSNLFRFLEYIKKNLSQVSWNSWLYHGENETDSQITHHHPCHYIKNMKRLEHSNWLKRMLEGVQPGTWMQNFDVELDRLRAIPSGHNDKSRPSQSGNTDEYFGIKNKFVKQLAQTLKKHDIISDYWLEFDAAFKAQYNTGDPNEIIFIRLLGIYHVFDNQQSLHNTNQDDTNRLNTLMCALINELQFSPDCAAAFVEGISVWSHSAIDFIRALAEYDIRCNDFTGFVNQIEAYKYTHTVESNPLARSIIEATTKDSFIYGGGEKIDINDDAPESLKCMLLRDFGFKDGQARKFISMINLGPV